MPREKAKAKEKSLCVDKLRHTEYYGMQEVFDNLYARSKSNGTLDNLVEIILSRENILLAYRNLKTNSGSNTPGTDGLTIDDIKQLTADEVVNKIRRIVTSKKGYNPKAVRRKDIPKPYDPAKTRPLGIPCIWDRLIQQCIKQVMEPICEAKFSEHSYGFRPNRSVEHAIAETYMKLNIMHLHYVVEFDIKGFFDNVDHSKLIRQIWAMGVHDKHLIYIIRQILKAPILMPNGDIMYPHKGTPQGGIISPLLANIVLNELDHWIESNWENNPVTRNYSVSTNSRGCENKGSGYRAMRETKLKEMYIIRYADDFRIFCRTKNQAERTKVAVTKWLADRLKLEISQEKTKIVNVKRKYSEFLGFKIKVHSKSGKFVTKSHISDKQLNRECLNLVEQAKNIAKPRHGKNEYQEIRLYNAMVMGIQSYYCIATHVSMDCKMLHRRVMTVLTNRLRAQEGTRLVKNGRKLTNVENKRYGKSKMLRYTAGTDEPIYPIGYIQCKKPMSKKRRINSYTAEGRAELHDNLRINTGLMLKLMRQPLKGRSVEYADNRISLYSAQWGKCAITGIEFKTIEEIHCHHKIPRKYGGTDAYENLTLVNEMAHRLIHASEPETIGEYRNICSLNNDQMKRLNELRKMAKLEEIDITN